MDRSALESLLRRTGCSGTVNDEMSTDTSWAVEFNDSQSHVPADVMRYVSRFGCLQSLDGPLLYVHRSSPRTKLRQWILPLLSGLVLLAWRIWK